MPCLPNAYTHLLSSPYKELVVWLLVTSSHWRGQAEIHQVFRITEFQAVRLLLKTNTFFYSKASPLLRRKYNCHALCSYDCPSSCTILLIIWGLWVQINWEDNLMTEREIISCKWYLLLELWKGSQGSLLFFTPFTADGRETTAWLTSTMANNHSQAFSIIPSILVISNCDDAAWFRPSISFLQMKNVRLREVKWLAKHHTAWVYQNQVLLSSKLICWDFSGGPVAKTPCSQCSGPEFNPRSGN